MPPRMHFTDGSLTHEQRQCPCQAQSLWKMPNPLQRSLGDVDFKLTLGWLSLWKDRYNNFFKKIHGEKRDADLISTDN